MALRHSAPYPRHAAPTVAVSRTRLLSKVKPSDAEVVPRGILTLIISGPDKYSYRIDTCRNGSRSNVHPASGERHDGELVEKVLSPIVVHSATRVTPLKVAASFMTSISDAGGEIFVAIAINSELLFP